MVAIESLGGTPVSRRRIEIVERKGLGHPDTICDTLVEAISLGLSRLYLARCGAIAHYNVDKALLIAGQCVKGFGQGELTRPIELLVGDRATVALDGEPLPIEETARAAVDEWVAAHLPRVRPGRDLRTRLVIAPGSEELTRIFRDREGPLAGSNDTCVASGFAPLSPTEETVLAVERFLNSADFKRRFPDTGEDVKVLGVRDGERLALTIAMPFHCLATPSEAAYFRRKDEALAVLARELAAEPFTLEWALNTLDRPGRGTAGAYLTLTGTSAEDADSGQVGRGNRVHGLISVSRPTGGEAAPGKNPVAHVGKIYSVLSHRLARLVHARCPELEEVYVHLSARIGEPVDRPWVGVQLRLPRHVAVVDVEDAIRETVAAELARMPEFIQELVRGEYPVC